MRAISGGRITDRPNDPITFALSTTRPAKRFGIRWTRMVSNFIQNLRTRLAELERLAIPIVVTPGKRGTAHPYSFSRILERVTMEACRHGGLTELGNVEPTEQQEMSLSGHRSPNALRRYIKKTESQRLATIRKRRAWVLQEEHARNESQNEDPAAEVRTSSMRPSVLTQTT